MATADKIESVQLTCSTEYKDYVYNEKHEIWSLVTLKAPCMVDDEKDEQRPPIDVVLVIDKSGSMAGKKIALIKKSLEFFLTQLNDKDRLSLVTYDTNVYLDFGLKKMNKDNKEDALRIIKNISDGSCTNLCGGLLKGLEEVMNRKSDDKNEVASVLLFTDGLANSGITSSAGIIAAMKDPKRFVGPTYDSSPQQPKRQSFLNKMLPKKKPQEDKEKESSSGNGSAADATVYTFGFGDDHNPDMLKEISDAGSGMYYFIQNEDQIVESFGHCLGGIMSTVAQGIQLEVTLEKGVTIKEVHTGRPYEKLTNGVKVNMGDLQSEETRDVVIELILDKVSSTYTNTPQLLFNTRCDLFNVVSNELETVKEKLTVLRPEKSENHDQTTADSALYQQRERVLMTRVLQEVRTIADTGDMERAKSVLTAQKTRITASKEAFGASAPAAAGYGAMEEDLDSYGAQLNDRQVWETKGKKMHMNLMQQHVNQRSSNVESSAYKSDFRSKKASKAKGFK